MTSLPRIRIPAVLTAGVVACVISACSVEATPAQPVTTTVAPTTPPSTLVVRWSVDEGGDPNECVATGSTSISITITDPSGLDVGTFEQDCTAFSTSITLGAGDYQGMASLLDADGQPRTTTVNIAPFTLVGDDTFVVTVDFPTSAFLQ